MEPEFYKADEILSKKFKKGLFGYSKTQTYSVFEYTLYNVVFDMTEIGKDPIKLVRSILLHTSIKDLISMQIDDILFDIFFFNVDEDKQKMFNSERKIAGLIQVFKKYENMEEKIKQITVKLLTEFLGAKYYKNSKEINFMCKYRRTYVFGNRELRKEKFDELVKWYNNKVKVFDFFLVYYNSTNKYLQNKLHISDDVNILV